MKITRILVLCLIASCLFAVSASAEEKRDKQSYSFSPPSGSYNQIPLEKARKMKNYSPADQKEISVILEKVPDQENRNKK